jgi:chemotaxis protein methyltransferase CheR
MMDVEQLEIELLLEAIHRRYGYDLRGYARASMRRRVLLALARSGLDDLGELQHAVLTDPRAFASLLDTVTVRVTGMFRDPAFYRVFRERVVPHLRTHPTIRIWHAGCASGEEVYATAIVLHEEGLYDRAQLFASDLSRTALSQARRGHYPAAHREAAAAHHREAGGKADLTAYCTEGAGHFAIAEPLRRHILFFQHDLLSDHAVEGMQVVFCRNVLMYFNADLKPAVIAKLASSLGAGGFLCLGNGERLPAVEEARGFVELAGRERIYRHDPDRRPR